MKSDNEALIQTVATQIWEEGDNPNTQNVHTRIRIQHQRNPSATTISQGVRDWWAALRQDYQSLKRLPGVSPEVGEWLIELMKRVQALADAQLKSKYIEADNQIKAALLQVQTHQESLQTLLQRLRETEKTLKKTEEQLTFLQSEHHQLQSRYQKAQQEMAVLQTTLENIRYQIAQEKEHYRDQFKLENRRYDEMERRLVSQMEDGKFTIKSLEKKMVLRDQEFRQLQLELTTAHQTALTWRTKHEGLDKEQKNRRGKPLRGFKKGNHSR